jgi:CoA-transferase family III
MEGALKAPLAGVTVVELSRGAAAAYAGRLLAILGAETILVEPLEGHVLRREPPFLAAARRASPAISQRHRDAPISLRCSRVPTSSRMTSMMGSAPHSTSARRRSGAIISA